MAFYDYVEIGTSDFETEIQKADGKIGLSIEPIKYYLDRLPDKPNCTKLNLAVSDHAGTCKVNYVSEEEMQKHQFPWWVRGCNSINSYHPQVAEMCRNLGFDISRVITSDTVEVVTLFKILSELSGVYFLKIDTEGHDVVILSQFAKDIKSNAMFPHVIKFESNHLTSASDVTRIIETFSAYDLVERAVDTTLKLNLQKLSNKQGFTQGINKYFITNYPPGYDVSNLPHDNTLEAAQAYCVEHQCAGVTLEQGIYQVRIGPYLNYVDSDSQSWVFV
jgi:FkbM family methyltransferase